MIKCAMNQSSDAGNKTALWKCKACGYVDTQTHILHCPRFTDLRESKSLESDHDLVEYFSKVLKIREDNNLLINHQEVIGIGPQWGWHEQVSSFETRRGTICTSIAYINNKKMNQLCI